MTNDDPASKKPSLYAAYEESMGDLGKMYRRAAENPLLNIPLSINEPTMPTDANDGTEPNLYAVTVTSANREDHPGLRRIYELITSEEGLAEFTRDINISGDGFDCLRSHDGSQSFWIRRSDIADISAKLCLKP